MRDLSWNFVNKRIDDLYSSIFENYNLFEMSAMQKREIIFDYIVNNIKYDFELLTRIKNAINCRNFKLCPRSNHNEFSDVLYNSIGICNTITQFYMLLLEKAGIYAQQICSSDGSEVVHAYAIVQSSTGYFSFDDPTSVIVKRGSKDDFFNYTIEEAYSNNQGLEEKFDWNDNKHFLLIDPAGLFVTVKRNDYKSFYSNLLYLDYKDLNTTKLLSLIKEASS